MVKALKMWYLLKWWRNWASK
ncbi:hypothetical protein Patl1_11378 [Pistacia atlantica]|uniref:Uncharacterized protein n=1 Tax=Pistacia atlantica TaxID=434234 RepID=A0ACC1A0Y2_9ROSI|nr:hypothetical protein Patl1_11378 [Pistacia atlantica]